MEGIENHAGQQRFARYANECDRRDQARGQSDTQSDSRTCRAPQARLSVSVPFDKA